MRDPIKNDRIRQLSPSYHSLWPGVKSEQSVRGEMIFSGGRKNKGVCANTAPVIINNGEIWDIATSWLLLCRLRKGMPTLR